MSSQLRSPLLSVLSRLFHRFADEKRVTGIYGGRKIGSWDRTLQETEKESPSSDEQGLRALTVSTTYQTRQEDSSSLTLDHSFPIHPAFSIRPIPQTSIICLCLIPLLGDLLKEGTGARRG